MIIEYFLEWIKTAPLSKQVEATTALVRTFLFSKSIDNKERLAIEGALSFLVKEGAVPLRQAIASTLASAGHVPHHLVFNLAQDHIDVARPVLEKSPLLTDADLITLLNMCSLHHSVVIATRMHLPGMVARQIVLAGAPEACRALVRNPSAAIQKADLLALVERFGADKELRSDILKRPDLPGDVRHALVLNLGESLQNHILQHGGISPEQAKTLVQSQCDKSALELAANAPSGELAEFISFLQSRKRLTPLLLIRAAVLGHIRFIEAALCQLTGLPSRRVCALVDDRSRFGVEALCARAGLQHPVTVLMFCAFLAFRKDTQEATALDGYAFSLRVLELFSEEAAGLGHDENVGILALVRKISAEAASDAFAASTQISASQGQPIPLPKAVVAALPALPTSKAA